MNDFNKNEKFDFDDDFFNDEDINYQSYSTEIKGRKKFPFSNILLAILLIVVIILVIIVLKNSIGNDDDGNNKKRGNKTTTSDQTQTTLPPNFSADNTTHIYVTDDEVEPDNDKTITLSKSDIKKGLLVLINNNYSYQYDTTQGGLENLYGTSTAYVLSGSKLQVTKETRTNLNKWLEDFKQTNSVSSGKNIIITDAFRSDADQTILFNNAVKYYGSEEEAKKHVQMSGHSEHHSGLCVDIKIWDGTATTQIINNPEFTWLLDNAYKYGFIQRYPDGKSAFTGVASEPEHFRYIGVAHATAMKQNNVGYYESYIEYLKNYTFWGEHLYVECDNGDKYEIYFSDTDTIIAPTDREYTISGNNADGFIITIKY